MGKIKKIIASFIAFTTIFFSTSALFSCGRKDMYSEALKIGVDEVPKTLMPYASTSSSNIYAISNIYNTLLQNHLEPKGYEKGNDFYFESGEKYEPLNSDENYFMFEDGLFEKEGAYLRKEGSRYGYTIFTPTKEEYEKQLERKNIIKGEDEVGDPIEETEEEFIERRERVVPKDNWLEYRFKVRDGYTWNDGIPFTAKDVEFTFKYVLKHRGALASIAFFLTNYYDCYTEENGDFVLKLATNKISDIKTITTAIMILPEHIWKDIKKPAEEKNISPVGTGPYKVKENGFIEDSSLALELRKDYDKNLLDEIFYNDPINEIFMTRISNQDVMLNAMQKGEIDVCLDGIGTQMTKVVNESPKYNKVKTASSPSPFVTTLAFNMGKNGIFNDKNMENSYIVRKALSLAIDQEKIIDVILFGEGEKVNDGLVQSFHPHALRDEKGNYILHKTDIAEANRLLDEAGYKKNSKGMRNLSFGVYAGKGSEPLVNYIGQLFKEVGVTLTFELAGTDYEEETKQRNNPDFDMVINSVNMEVDKLLMFDARFGVYPNGSVRTWNVTGLIDKELSQLMWEMDTEMDIFKQYEKSRAVQKRLATLYAEVPLYNGYSHSAYTCQRFTGWVETKMGDILNSYSMRYLKAVK